MRACWLTLLLLVSGCARNAVFELELDLPPEPASAGPLFAVLQVRTDADFGADWTAVPQLEGIPLRPTCARPVVPPPCDSRELAADCSTVVSIVGEGDDLERPLFARVRFCGDPSCSAEGEGAAQTRIEVERALYRGRFTQGRVCIDELPTSPSPEPVRIERCDVRCRDGEAISHCRADGTHFCDSP